MAVTYGFYNSLNKDRVYNAEQMSAIFDGVITDGVFASIADHMMPVAGTGLQVIVKPGKCWFNHTWTLNDAELPLTIATADVSLTRIDAIVVEINSAVGTRANSIKVIKGIPSANPAKPTLSATENLHQYALGYVKVTPGMTSVTADKIEVNVGKSTCPFVTSVLQQTDITDLFNQWDAEFNAWFENVQSQLSGDIAANLQRQIDAVKDSVISDETAKVFDPAITNPTGEDIFSWLSKYNMHWWREFTMVNGHYEIDHSNAKLSINTLDADVGVDIVTSLAIDKVTGRIYPKDATHLSWADVSGSTKQARLLAFGNAIIAKAPCWLYHMKGFIRFGYDAAVSEYSNCIYVPKNATCKVSDATFVPTYDSDEGDYGLYIHSGPGLSYPGLKRAIKKYVSGTITDPVMYQTPSKSKDAGIITTPSKLQIATSSPMRFKIETNSGAPTYYNDILYADAPEYNDGSISIPSNASRIRVSSDDANYGHYTSNVPLSTLKGKYFQKCQWKGSSNAFYARTSDVYYMPEDYGTLPDVTVDSTPFILMVPLVYTDHSIESNTVTQYLGQPFQNFPAMPRLMTGFYEGNGGVAQVNINCGFKPRFIIITQIDVGNVNLIWIENKSGDLTNGYTVTATETGFQLALNNTTFNSIKKVYAYLAIG